MTRQGNGCAAKGSTHTDALASTVLAAGQGAEASESAVVVGPASALPAQGLSERRGQQVDSSVLPLALRERYEDLWLLGEGGMGTVYRGRDKRLGRTVALKLLRRADPDLAKRLLQEARAQARVEHELVCRVYEAGEADGEPFISMQYIQGDPLDRAKERMTLEQKVKIIREVCAALHEAHRIGLVHRDIKPGNILVETAEDGAFKPYVVDFGLARDVSQQGQTMTGAVLGTPAFMAPEQARGEARSLDRRTDVYSLGATLYAVLAGRPPFVAEHPWKVLAMVADEEAPPLRSVVKQVPADLETIVMKCVQREPSQRYESARAVGEDLQRFLDGDPIQARRAALGYVLWRKARKHWLRVLLAAVAVTAAAVPAGAWVKARRDAAAQVVLARELGEDVKEMELFLRSAYTLPLHDVEKERDVVRARLGEIERRMVAAGEVGEGPGHYALGRGYLALGDAQMARDHLEKALAAGYSSVELRYALGRALGELYKEALEKTKRMQNKAAREAKVREIEASLRDPALAHLGAAVGATIDSPDYAEGLIAFYAEKYEEALAKAKEAFEKASWLYEAKKLEGDVQYVLGSRYRHDADMNWDKMMAHFGPAADAYRVAANMARSDPEVHRAECELWTQTMATAVHTGQPQRASFDKAKEACARAVAASSTDGRARIQRAFAYAGFAAGQTGNPTSAGDPRALIEEAMHFADEAVHASPQDPMAHWILGVVALNQMIYARNRGYDPRTAAERASAAQEAVLRIDPQFVWALMDLGTVNSERLYLAARNGLDFMPPMKAAERVADRLIAIDPSYVLAWTLKADIYDYAAQALVERGQSPHKHVQRALDAIREVERLAPGSPFGAYSKTWTFIIMATYEIQAGQDHRQSFEQAVQSAEQLNRLMPDDPQDDLLVGDLRYAEALHLLLHTSDPEPALRRAREAYRRAAEASPWNILYAVGCARIEILALRWGMTQHKVRPAMFEAALAPLRPLLSEERLAPEFYQALAEIHSLRAAWMLETGKSPAGDVGQGLAMARKALSINPRMATAFAAKAHVHLVEAHAAQDRSIRTEAARRAEEAFRAAFQNNPLLERQYGDALREAERLR